MEGATATAGVAQQEPFSRLGSRSSKLIRRRRFLWAGGLAPSQFFLTGFNEPINAQPPLHPPTPHVPYPPPNAAVKVHPYPFRTDKDG